jgi:hypothetical protein
LLVLAPGLEPARQRRPGGDHCAGPTATTAAPRDQGPTSGFERHSANASPT